MNSEPTAFSPAAELLATCPSAIPRRSGRTSPRADIEALRLARNSWIRSPSLATRSRN